jgi:hypothetical protein
MNNRKDKAKIAAVLANNHYIGWIWSNQCKLLYKDAWLEGSNLGSNEA